MKGNRERFTEVYKIDFTQPIQRVKIQLKIVSRTFQVQIVSRTLLFRCTIHVSSTVLRDFAKQSSLPMYAIFCETILLLTI